MEKQGAVSGERDCPVCSERGLCKGTFLDVSVEEDEFACLSVCQSLADCQWISYHLTTGNCELFSDCHLFEEDAWEFVSSNLT